MIVIDYRDKRPLYEQITEKIAQLIILGVWEPNTKLPSVRALAMELSINPNTIQRAYNQLEQDGYIYTVVGRGNYVTDTHEWKNSYQITVTEELKDCIKKAKEAGLTLERVIELVKACFEDSPPAETS